MKPHKLYILSIILLIFSIMLNSCKTENNISKEDTIAWLEDKLMKNYGFYTTNAVEIIEINERRISIKENDGYGNYTIRTFPVGIKWKRYYYDFDGRTGIETVSGSNAVEIRSLNLNDAQKRLTGEVTYNNTVLIRENEKDLIDRIIKALEHLASFAQKNEKF